MTGKNGTTSRRPYVNAGHRADAELYGRDTFTDVTKSIALYNKLGRPGGDFQAWEWPRRLAALDLPVMSPPVQERLSL